MSHNCYGNFTFSYMKCSTEKMHFYFWHKSLLHFEKLWLATWFPLCAHALKCHLNALMSGCHGRWFRIDKSSIMGRQSKQNASHGNFQKQITFNSILFQTIRLVMMDQSPFKIYSFFFLPTCNMRFKHALNFASPFGSRVLWVISAPQSESCFDSRAMRRGSPSTWCIPSSSVGIHGPLPYGEKRENN